MQLPLSSCIKDDEYTLDDEVQELDHRSVYGARSISLATVKEDGRVLSVKLLALEAASRPTRKSAKTLAGKGLTLLLSATFSIVSGSDGSVALDILMLVPWLGKQSPRV